MPKTEYLAMPQNCCEACCIINEAGLYGAWFLKLLTQKP